MRPFFIFHLSQKNFPAALAESLRHGDGLGPQIKDLQDIRHGAVYGRGNGEHARGHDEVPG